MVHISIGPYKNVHFLETYRKCINAVYDSFFGGNGILKTVRGVIDLINYKDRLVSKKWTFLYGPTYHRSTGMEINME